MSACGQGYLSGTVLGVKLKAHRVAFAVYYGRWPSGCIDHIDGDRANNSINNLVEASEAQNAKNRGLTRANTSGAFGVFFRKRTKKWEAQITVAGKTHYLGEFGDKDQAIIARKNAEKRFGFHENHGSRLAVLDYRV